MDKNDFVQLEVGDALKKFVTLPQSQAEEWRSAYLAANHYDLAAEQSLLQIEPEGEPWADGSLPLATVDHLPGRIVSQYVGFPRGVVYQGVDFVSDMLGDVKAAVGASSGSVSRYASQAADKAIANMVREARRMGADAVIGVTVSVMPSMSGVRHVVLASAMGTAVKLAPRDPGNGGSTGEAAEQPIGE